MCSFPTPDTHHFRRLASAEDMADSQRLPNLFIVGAPKCGTTSLYHYLNDHSQVFFSPVKEPRYWSPDFPDPIRRVKSLEQYLKLFQSASQNHKIIGEASTTYLRSDEALGRILEFNPNAKFICMVRNPLEFLPAYHMELHLTFHEDIPTLEQAWHLQEPRRLGQCIPSTCAAAALLDYSQAALFGQQVRQFCRLIPERQRMIIVFDDFAKDTQSVYEQVLTFLELDSDGRTEFARSNEARQYRFQILRRLVIRPPAVLAGVITPIRRFLGVEGINILRFADQLVTRRAQRRSLRQEFRQILASEFSSDIELLSMILGRDLSHWTRIDAGTGQGQLPTVAAR